MGVSAIASSSSLTDEVVLFELDVFNQIDTGQALFNARINGTAPLIIGLDRTTVKHSLNVLSSFNSVVLPRPTYTDNIDIIGLQSKGNDISAT